MPKIKRLDRKVYEQIAAGEVVERPASVVKELVENSIDAGAKNIEVSVKRNGLVLIRVTDDGCGIAAEDVETAFLRHATSKVSDSEDLERIHTLGFRGEALAAISSVSEVSMITKTADEEFGVRYHATGGEESTIEIEPSPDGTSVSVSNLFFNTPARMKFLKKDTAEGNAIQIALEHLALSRPDISFKLFRDDKLVVATPGNGDMYADIYSILPHDIADNMFRVSDNSGRFNIDGYIIKPKYSRKSRSFQYLYVNGRYVKSKLCVAAVEEAYKTLMMVGHYPCFVLKINVPYELVDVNVHPAKTEVKFADEREVYGAIYSVVRSAVLNFAESFKSQIGNGKDSVSDSFEQFSNFTSEDNIKSEKNTEIFFDEDAENKKSDDSIYQQIVFDTDYLNAKNIGEPINRIYVKKFYENSDIEYDVGSSLQQTEKEKYIINETECKNAVAVRVIGELMKTYIVAELDDCMILIDKHAAHERILFERLNDGKLNNDRQILIEPVSVSVSVAEKDLILSNMEMFGNLGFSVEDFGVNAVCVREAPTYFPISGIAGAILEIAEKMEYSKGKLSTKEEEWLLHSVACRSAIKAGHKTTDLEIERLVNDIINGTVPKYCPHGRPVIFSMTKKEIEKSFGRIQ